MSSTEKKEDKDSIQTNERIEDAICSESPPLPGDSVTNASGIPEDLKKDTKKNKNH